jgi:hypothetical protein
MRLTFKYHIGILVNKIKKTKRKNKVVGVTAKIRTNCL